MGVGGVHSGTPLQWPSSLYLFPSKKFCSLKSFWNFKKKQRNKICVKMKRVKSHALKAQKNAHKNGQKTGLHANAIRARYLQKRHAKENKF
jgi:hypothetical protein